MVSKIIESLRAIAILERGPPIRSRSAAAHAFSSESGPFAAKTIAAVTRWLRVMLLPVFVIPFVKDTSPD
jgi:hypothetical protein